MLATIIERAAKLKAKRGAPEKAKRPPPTRRTTQSSQKSQKKR
jgi:hypothetical protein